jgi:hypothetical protein
MVGGDKPEAGAEAGIDIKQINGKSNVYKDEESTGEAIY